MGKSISTLFMLLFSLFLSESLLAFSIQVTGTDITCNGAADGSATVVVLNGNGGNYTYQWSNGETTATISNLDEGAYSVTVTENTGATQVGAVYISQPAPISLVMNSSYETCDVSDDGTAGVLAYGGTPPYTLQWSDPAAQTFWVAYNLSAGDYSVTVTDANGCTAVGTVTVEMSPEGIWLGTTATDATCAGSCDGTATTMPMTGTPPYTYQWSGTTQTTDHITGLCPGTYSVTVTDANGCSAVDQATVNEPPALQVSVTSAPSGCSGTSSGSASASPSGGTPGYTYLWSNGQTSMTIMGLAPGTYSVTVTDANGCTAVGSTEVLQSGSSDLVFTLSANDVTCNGNCDGNAEVTIVSGTAPYTYSWSTGASGSSVSGLCAGQYAVTVSDASGCPVVQTFFIGEPDPIGLSFSATDASCGATDGTATVTASGGNGGYTYAWSTGQTTATATGLGPGTYSVTVTDQLGCSATGQVDVGVSGTGITATISSEPASCSDSNDGSATVTVTSGTPPYVYEWSNGATGSTATGLAAGDYSVTIMDAVGCPLVLQTTVTAPPPIDITITTTPASCGQANGSASATVSGGVGGYTYLWSNGDTTPTITDLPAGNYTLAVADANLCLANETVTVEQSGGQVIASATSTPVSCNGGSDGTASIGIDSGTPPYSFEWSTGETTQSITGLTAGGYGWTVTDASGCMATGMVQVTQPDALQLTTESQPASCGVDNGMASVTVSGGTPPYTYKWNDPFGQTGYAAMNLAPGTYIVLVTDANGCTANATVEVESIDGFTCNAMVSSSYNGADISSIGGSDGAATVVMNGGNPGYFSFAWSNGQTTQQITGLSAGTYSVVVKDDLTGCTCESSVTLQDPAKIGDLVWLDLNSNGIQDAGEMGIEGVQVNLTGTSDNGLMLDLTTTTDASGMYMFTLAPGTYKLTFTLPPNHDFTVADAGGDDAVDSDVDTATGMTTMVSLSSGVYDDSWDAGLIKTCVAVGDFVWYDDDQNGFQYDGVAGVAGVTVELISAGPDGLFKTADDVVEQTTSTDASGHYLFDCVLPGTYVVRFSNIPAGYEFSPPDAVFNDGKDSDAGEDGYTSPFDVSLATGDNLTIDAGIHTLCDNVTNPGTIGYDQSICPGQVPNQLVTVTPPSGGSGAFEYIWMKAEPGAQFEIIPGSTTPDYQPPALYTTTRYRKCVRRAGCVAYLEPPAVTITVMDTCGGNFVSISASMIQQGQAVQIEWMTVSEQDGFKYQIERSANGEDFTVMDYMPGYGNTGGPNQYKYVDEHPRVGTNFYRVVMKGANGFEMASNVVKVLVHEPGVDMAVFPNPASDVFYVDAMKKVLNDGLVEVFGADGKLVKAFVLSAGEAGPRKFLVDNLSGGTYFVKVTVGGQLRVMKLNLE